MCEWQSKNWKKASDLFNELDLYYPDDSALDSIGLVFDKVERLEAAVVEYHEVMGLLKRSRMRHGTCEPPERNACSACMAVRGLDMKVKNYRGAPVVAQENADAKDH